MSQPTLHTGAVPAVRAPPAAPVGVDAAVRPQLGQTQPVTSPASQLRSKYGQLTDLLQSTALQRGISLSQVPIPPTQKSGKGQPKRVSLEEVRTSFRSFTASTAANSSKPCPSEASQHWRHHSCLPEGEGQAGQSLAGIAWCG